jgi:gamma-glutamyltranspeptidase/glutathione hydrolase
MRLALISALALLTSGCALAPQAATDAASTSSEWRLNGRAMAAAADARAVDAALAVMSEGGSAVDAAIAAHAVLGLVEPQSSGIGGGGFMVVYHRASNTIRVFDGRETAPATASENLFDYDGRSLGFLEAVNSGRSVGVPSAVALYKAAHDAYGTLAWSRAFEPAIRLAEDGFVVSPRLAQLVAIPRVKAGPLGVSPGPGDYFFPNGTPLAAGDRRTNPDYARMLRRVASEGPAAFYSGDIARDIVNAVRQPGIPGDLTLEDLASYRVKTVDPVCGPFKSYRICSAPPPSSGGVAMTLAMGLYERLSAASPDSGQAADLRDFVLAQQLAYADRDHYVADPAAVTVPTAELTDQRYLDARAATAFRPGDAPAPGDPGAVIRGQPIIDMWGREISAPQPGTTHLSIVDHAGNAVSFTATIEGLFGSSRWTNGFLLNNQLTDFSRPVRISGKPVANAPGPGKRPRSSMSPTIVFDANGELFMVTGSPGGNSIVGYVAKTLAAVLDWDRSAQEAAALPNIVARGQTVRVETDAAFGKEWADLLSAAGFRVQGVQGEASGLHIIVAREDGYEGGADPRREGVARESVR